MQLQRNTSFKQRFLTIVSCILILLAGGATSAEPLIVLDQNGDPVVDAIVGLPGKSLSTDNTPSAHHSTPADKNIAIMDQVNKQFAPHVLVIQQGQAVSFPNSDDIRHHVYSFSETKPFELRLYSGTPKDPIVFEKPGIVVLGCNIHDHMVGYIYVSETDQVFKTDKNGLIDIPFEPGDVYVWHEKMQGQRWEKRPSQASFNAQNKRWEIILPIEKDTKAKKKSTFKSGFSR